MAVATKAALKAALETGDTITEATLINLIDSCYNTFPMNVGAYLATASAFINDSRAGFYWSLDAASDDEVFGNIPLDTYTGGNLKAIVKGRKSAIGTGTIGLVLRYKLIKDGDDTATGATVVAQLNTVVDAETANVQFSIDLGSMTGVVGATTLMLGIERNSTGASADTYAGNYEITDVVVDYA